jgi:predicted protein tyrosine phosphatase
MRVLFVCSRNRLRSPTAEHVFAGVAGLEVDSAGLSNDAETILSAEQVTWADIIFVMESAHRMKLSKKYQAHLRGKKVVCLDIPDEYDYMDPVLVKLLEAGVLPHIPDGASNTE